MATNLLGDFYRRANQRRVTTGFGLTQGESAGALDAALADQRAMREQAFRNSLAQQQLGIQQDQISKQNKAASISGLVNIGQLGGSMYLGNKYLGLLGGKAPGATPVADSFASNLPSTSSMEYLSQAPFRTPGYTAPSLGAATAQGAVAPSMGATTAQGSLLSGGIPELSAPGALSAPGYTAPLLDAPTSLAPAAAAPPTGAGMGLLPGLGQAAALYGAQQATAPWIHKALGNNLPLAQKGWQYAGLPGAATGATIDAVKGIGSVVHNIISSISSIF